PSIDYGADILSQLNLILEMRRVGLLQPGRNKTSSAVLVAASSIQPLNRRPTISGKSTPSEFISQTQNELRLVVAFVCALAIQLDGFDLILRHAVAFEIQISQRK